jgi:hypothetical protein
MLKLKVVHAGEDDGVAIAVAKTKFVGDPLNAAIRFKVIGVDAAISTEMAVSLPEVPTVNVEPSLVRYLKTRLWR